MAKTPSRPRTKPPAGNSVRATAKLPARSQPAITRKARAASKVGQLTTLLRVIEGVHGKRGKSVSRKDYNDALVRLRISDKTAKTYSGSALKSNKNGTVSVSKTDAIERVMEVYTPNAANGNPGKRWVKIKGYKQAQELNAYIQATEQLRTAKTVKDRQEAIESLNAFNRKTIRFGIYRVRLLTDPDALTETMKAEGSLERYKQEKR